MNARGLICALLFPRMAHQDLIGATEVSYQMSTRCTCSRGRALAEQQAAKLNVTYEKK